MKLLFKKNNMKNVINNTSSLGVHSYPFVLNFRVKRQLNVNN
jgi:hypothetical protein